MNVTSALFEAFLKCPTKCYLRSTGQADGENAYAEWVRAQNDAYRSKTAKRRIEATAGTEGPVASPAAKDLKTAAWRLAVDLHVKAGAIESRIHAVERQPPQGQRSPAQFIPIRLHEPLGSYGSYRPAVAPRSTGQWAKSVGSRKAVLRIQSSARRRCRLRRLYLAIAQRARRRFR